MSCLSRFILVLAILVAVQPSWALRPDEIALVVNGAVPESAELARFYAQARGIPDDRIIVLNLPTVEEMQSERFDRDVRPAVRKFLTDRQLVGKVKCLVTFYGVPLRILDRGNPPIDNLERARLIETAAKVTARTAELVGHLENRAREFNPSFVPASTDGAIDGLARRADFAGRALTTASQQSNDPQVKQRINAAAIELTRMFQAPVDIPADPNPPKPPATMPSPADINVLLDKPFDRDTRMMLRASVRQYGGIFAYAKVLQDQIGYLSTEATAAAFDNELALTLWPAYSKTRWQPNPLNPRFREMRAGPVLMVMRLDAPTPQMVRDMIANTLSAEREGITGKFVIDARGIAPKNAAGADDAFGVFDERLRNLAEFIKSKSEMPLQLDNQANVLQPGAASDVALYCGWYSLRHYVPGMKFNKGAIGYHVASFELVGLHGPHENGWVRGLLQSGVVSTLGPVAEPYLHSFPLPEEFFPLLMTGKVTLAEAYWLTNPLTSWMQTFIGDPLYTPFAKTPKVKVEDLSQLYQDELRRSSAPTTGPG